MRTNSINAQTELIQPQDVLDSSIQRYHVVDGYLERVEDLGQDGTVIRAMIANYRTGKIVQLDMRSKTYTTNVILKRQQNILPSTADPAEGPKLAPQTDLADYLAQLASDRTKPLAAQQLDGRPVVGYRAELTQQASVWKHTLWVDQQSMRPVRTIITFRNEHPGVGASDWICDNFVFDADLPRSLFSTDPPPGFMLRNIVPRAGEAPISGIPLP